MHKSQNYMQWIKRKSKMLPRQQYYQDRVQLTDRLQDVFADVEILVGTPLTTQNDSSYSSHYIIPYLILHCDKRCMSEWGVVDDESFPSNLRTPSDSASCMWLKTRRHYPISSSSHPLIPSILSHPIRYQLRQVESNNHNSTLHSTASICHLLIVPCALQETT